MPFMLQFKNPNTHKSAMKTSPLQPRFHSFGGRKKNPHLHQSTHQFEKINLKPNWKSVKIETCQTEYEFTDFSILKML